jgi:hypothetical protein
MEADNYLKNNVGDVLSPIRHNEKVSLFQVIDATALQSRDVFFVCPTEVQTDIYGRKVHLSGGNAWENAGCYVRGRAAAEAKFAELSPGAEEREQKEKYYEHNTK